MMDNKMPALLGAVAALLAAPASAALFRCGNVFQDRPCDGGVQQEAPRSAGPASASQSPASAPRASQQQSAASAPRAPQQQSAASTPRAAQQQSAASAPSTQQQSAASAPEPRQAAAVPRGAASAPGTLVARTGPASPACPGLRDQREAIDAQLRAGGSPRTIEMYQRQRREIEQYMAEANCP